jgi:glycosyltransferase involved in cell wall biosynthesis
LAARNDIAIYAPFAFAYYEDPGQGGGAPLGGGGGEFQTTLLARELAQRGLRVAHILHPIKRLASPAPPVEIVERKPDVPRRDAIGKLVEVLRMWRGLAAADARLYLFRGGGGQLMIGACFCLLRRRQFVLSASNDLDFVRRTDRGRLGQAVYRMALRRARCVVVQTSQQLDLARRELGNGARVELIPSFAEPADGSPPSAEPEAFLWVGRLVDYKLPLRYVELARALPEARFRMITPTTLETPEALSRQLAEASDELPNLELLPRQWRQRVLELVSRSTAVVVTSRYEGMPNVFLEAWARGAPVISLHFDPDGKIAEQGLGLFAAGSWGRFVDGARSLWHDPGLRREMGARARDYVAREHSPATVGKRWAEVLRHALTRE